jgi:hypothetical protein
MRNNIPVTYTVRTGRRTSYAVQMYYSGALEYNGAWEMDGCRGEIRSAGALVMATGNIHPDTGEVYELLVDAAIAPRPDVFVQAHKRADTPGTVKPGDPLPMLGKGDGRHPLLLNKLGSLHRAGMTEAEALGAAMALNETRFSDPISQDEIEKTVASCWAKWNAPEELGTGTIGGTKTPEGPVDWRTRYHTFEEMDQAPAPTFLIDGFLQRDVITALAAPVAQRKSLIAANVAHAALTGDSLFDHFKVTEKPTRVIYLCPEMGIHSFTDRLRKLGLMEYVGKTLFCRTMNSEGHLALADLTPDELSGALVIVDTAVRFIKGDENSSEHMRVFAEDCFGVMKAGAASILVLFHSGKGTKETTELTLENAMRGSGELGAFISSCWATRLQNPDEPYQSASFLTNVKQRDFESKPFEVTSGPDCRLHIVAAPSAAVVLTGKPKGVKGNADGREEEALQVIRDNSSLTIPKIVLKLEERGIIRRNSWVGTKRAEMLKTGVRVTTTV